MNIYLVGYRGTGKTALARALSIQLGRMSVDTDDLIVESEGMSIPHLFEEKGEVYFRDAETRILQEVSRRDDLVVATGGGIIGREDNRGQIKSTGVCIYLTADPDVIYKRISGDSNRPALTRKSEKEEIIAMLKKRNAWYEEVGQIKIDTGTHTMAECLEQVIQFIEKKGVLR